MRFLLASQLSLLRMKALLFFLGSSLLGIEAAHAQTSYAAPATTTAQQLAQDLGVDRIRYALTPSTADLRNATSLLQTGANNTAVIDQTNQAVLANQAAIQQNGTGNMLGLTQTGSDNQTNFSQTGSGNQAALRQQGTSNTINGQVAGNDNEVAATQQGTGNQYSTQLAGSRGRYTIEQLGNNNTLTQRETATSTPLPGYSVKMEGSGMHLTIEQGKVFP
jgi:hypothetical protein